MEQSTIIVIVGLGLVLSVVSMYYYIQLTYYNLNYKHFYHFIEFIKANFFYKLDYKKIKITVEDTNPELTFIVETGILIDTYDKEDEEEFLQGIIKLYDKFHDVTGEYIK